MESREQTVGCQGWGQEKKDWLAAKELVGDIDEHVWELDRGGGNRLLNTVNAIKFSL